MTAEELRLELACALYARGKISTIGGAELAGVDFFTFQMACRDRGIPKHYAVKDLEQDIATLNRLFPENPLPNPKG
jgi:predicted HTH domain antitoxin